MQNSATKPAASRRTLRREDQADDGRFPIAPSANVVSVGDIPTEFAMHAEIELGLVLQSKTFAKARRLRRMLEYIVRSFITGEHAPLKEYTIGVDVFDRGRSFDPTADPIVRVEASRLRTRLHSYYQSEGLASLTQIDIPKGGYLPTVRRLEDDPLAAIPLVGTAGFNSIAVLPFSGCTDQCEYCSRARIISEQLIHFLTRNSKALVVPRMSSLQTHHGMNARQIGEHLGAQIIIEGSIMCADHDCQVVTYIVDTIRGYNLWSGSYPAGRESMVTVTDKIAADLLSELRRRSLEIRHDA